MTSAPAASPVPPTSPVPPAPGGSSRAAARWGPWFAALWLFYLVDPLLSAWQRRDELRGVLGILAVAVFAGVYLALWIRARAVRARLAHNPPFEVAVANLLALVVLAALVVGLVGEPGLACAVYVAVAGVMVLRLRGAAVLTLALMAVVLGLGRLEHWSSQVSTAFAVLAASVAISGLRALISRNGDLIRMHEENAQLAVENERSRFARDLHDILGHSLTVITVKAELARRLLDVDTDRARDELADLERLSRDALADVRRAVQGYRELTLPGELARARTALATAEIRAELPNSTEEVPSELRELFAWTVREGVTNVIRHSRAGCCTVLLSPGCAEVRDDGRGPAAGEVPGSGLAGLRERAAAAGARVVTSPLDPGYSLRVVRA